MNTEIPSADDVSARLRALNISQLEALAATSGVPFATLMKVRTGETRNPGIETVRRFVSHIAAAQQADTKNPAPALSGQAQAATESVAVGEGARG